MAKITVYRFLVYSRYDDDWVISTRMGTLEGIEQLGKYNLVKPVLSESAEIDNSRLENGIPNFPDLTGLTALDFKP